MGVSNGQDIQGSVTELIVLRNQKSNRLAVYEFNVNNVVFTKEQRVKIQTYKNLEPGAVVPVKYLPSNPKFSFWWTKLIEIRNNACLFAGLSIMLALYINVLKEK